MIYRILSSVIFVLITGCIANDAFPTSTSSLVTESIEVAPTSTSTETVTSTSTPFVIPTGGFQNEDEYLSWLFSINQSESCILPCWWGFEPLQTNSSTVESILQSLTPQYLVAPDFILEDYRLLSLFVSDTYVGSIAANFWFKENVYEYVNFKFAGLPLSGQGAEFLQRNYSLSSILTNFGPPSEVLVGLVAAAPEPTEIWPYDLWLLYEDRGLILNYVGKYSLPDAGQDIKVCLDYEKLTLISIFLQPNENEDFTRVVDFNSGGGKGIESRIAEGALLPWEEATGNTINEFFTMFNSMSSNYCFLTPAELW